MVVDRLPRADGDVTQKHRLGQIGRVIEVGEGNRRLACPDRLDPFAFLVVVVVTLPADARFPMPDAVVIALSRGSVN